MTASDGQKSFPHLSALHAQRLLETIAYRIAPAAIAGGMAVGHLSSFGHGVIVFVSVLAASWILERNRFPLHLMPFAALILRASVPVLGVAIALATFSLSGKPEPASTLIAPILGAWCVMLFATWMRIRFDSSRQVRIAVIGSPGLAIGLVEELDRSAIRGYTVAGWITGDEPATNRGDGGPRRLGSLAEIREVVKEHSIDLLVHSSGPAPDEGDSHHSRLEVFERVAADCLDMPVRLIEAGQLYEELLGHVPLGQSNSAWFQYLLHPRYSAGLPGSKRAFDLIVGGAMLLILAPVIAVFSLIVKLTDSGPIFFRQLRVGEGGREFMMIKVRSMSTEAESEGARWSDAEDSRVTGVGRFMRRFHIDELPQLWNVITGEMTLVGPRPERRELITELELQLPYYDRRHLVKPGIAGWAQARCGYGGSEEGTGWKLCHDLFYLKHRSVYFDFLVLLENVRVSFSVGSQFAAHAPQEQFILGRPGHQKA